MHSAGNTGTTDTLAHPRLITHSLLDLVWLALLDSYASRPYRDKSPYKTNQTPTRHLLRPTGVRMLMGMFNYYYLAEQGIVAGSKVPERTQCHQSQINIYIDNIHRNNK